ncbi:hypothetical protein DICVIV_07238 [Dictyocaulus viviparus]|uniref:Chondroitin proteoglycan 3 n=1 Tax=Dictyocaulus viviparus TaxID=29172 RepID=A0A0D8XSJ8_DICVI|nr:hypothetical protein DICVIV_07238 [Dictyocaulus viviparus]
MLIISTTLVLLHFVSSFPNDQLAPKFIVPLNNITANSDASIQNRNEDNESSGEQPQAKGCFPLKLCYSDDECNGGPCIGAFVGKCNCNGCIDLWRCDSDSMCGGLKGACNLHTNTCDCTMGYMKAGFSSLSDALVNFCNVKHCTHQTEADDCFGLQCTAGSCLCLADL